MKFRYKKAYENVEYNTKYSPGMTLKSRLLLPGGSGQTVASGQPAGHAGSGFRVPAGQPVPGTAG